MPAPDKKTEVAYLERFRALLSTFPSGRIEPTEEPDFLVHGTDAVVGIELTELHRDTPPGNVPEQASEAMRRGVVTRAGEIYEATGGPPVYVTVVMDQQVHVRKRETEELAQSIFEIVIRNSPPPNGSREESYEWTNRSYFPEVVHKVTVRRFDWATESFFSCPGAIWVASLAPADIERVLAMKEPKCPTYRSRCDEVWLLINTNIVSMSTWFETDPAAVGGPFTTSFDRAFLSNYATSELFELSVQR